MKLHNDFSAQFIRLLALMLVVTTIVSGCSESGNSNTPNTLTPIDSIAPETINSETGNSDNNIASETIDVAEAEPGTEIDNAEILEDESETDSAEILEDGVNEPENSAAVVEDPPIQNTIPVTFDITVPWYLSNELRVELVWGEIYLTAMWVDGQRWSATGEFPTETEHPLTITFYDRNGAVELARYSQEYRVGSNATESVQIPAEQFDANQFDSDEDGINNLVELNAGTDPFVDEDSLLEIVDAFSLVYSGTQYSRISVSRDIESLVQQDRPYVEEYETDCCVQVGATGYYYKRLWGKFKINIDAAGNGTVEVIREETSPRNIPTLNATRTNSGSAISWEGMYGNLSPEYYLTENFTNTVSVVDDNLRSFVQEITGTNNGTYRFSWENNANLTGKRIEGSSLCEPVAGTMTNTRQTNYIDYPNTTTVVTNVSKEMDDPYWRVVTVENDSDTTEYFARKLKIAQDRDNAESSAFFQCEFVDY